jgi:hypothetical protein
MSGPSNERRRNLERRQRERRARIADLQANHDDLRVIIERNAEQIKRLEAEQQVQLIRIAQIQRELDALKKSR